MIKLIERSKIETKSFNLDFSNNLALEKSYKNDGKILHKKTDIEISTTVDEMAKRPIVWLNGVIIDINNINSLKLINDEFLPTLLLEFVDPSNKIIDENFPVDNSIISIFKDSTNKDTMSIKMDFKITDFKIIKGTSKENITFKIDAVVDVDGFYLMGYESYGGSTYNVLKTISRELNLGFATNIINTNDDMVWINPANYKIEFIKNIIKRSYINDDTFLFGYIDFYYNFNYIDIETQLNSDISTQMNMLDNKYLTKDNKSIITPLILSNNPDYSETNNMKINRYTVHNSSTNINLQYGYRHNITYYDKMIDNISNYNIDNISNGDGNLSVLKGNDDDDNILYDKLINTTWMGKMDTDNTHKNYLLSTLQNKNNLKFLQKLKMTVKIFNVNYSLYRFQKVLVELYNLSKIDEKYDMIKSETIQHEKKILHKLSGEWLITAIKINYSAREGTYQELTLVKRELTKKYTFPRKEKNQ